MEIIRKHMQTGDGCLSRQSRSSSVILASRLLAGLAAAMFLFCPQSIAAPGVDAELPKVLRVGMVTRVFRGADASEARVAVELWVRELSRIMGKKSSARVTVFQDSRAICDACRHGELDLITLPAIDYLKIPGDPPMKPVFIPSNKAGRGRRYLLIARRDRGIRTFSELRGKNLAFPPFAAHEPSHVWLDVLLMREAKTARLSFFRQVKKTSSESQAIMSLFFGQADAAVVSRGSFETALALNPQIKHRTRIIAESESLAGEITCVPSTADEKTTQTIVSAAMEMNNTTVGRQMSVLFQIDGIIPFKPSYLDGLTGLLREQAKLRASLAERR